MPPFYLESTGVKRVRGVEKNTAGTADGLRIVLAIASIAVVRSDVSTALGILVIGTSNADVTLLTPRGRPGVTNEPVLLAILLAVTHQDDSVVDVRVLLVATIEDTTLVGGPGGSIDGDGDRTNLGDGVHQGSVVVDRQLNIAVDGGLRRGTRRNVASSVLAVVRQVRVLELLEETVAARDIVEGDLRGSTLASTGTTAVIWVGGAHGDLLRAQVEKKTSAEGNVGLNDGSRSEGPAGTAVTLILNSGNDTLGAPVNILRKVDNRLQL